MWGLARWEQREESVHLVPWQERCPDICNMVTSPWCDICNPEVLRKSYQPRVARVKPRESNTVRPECPGPATSDSSAFLVLSRYFGRVVPSKEIHG